MTVLPQPRLRDYLLSIIVALCITIALVAAVMQPPLNDLMQLAGLFAFTGLLSAGVGFVAYRWGWWQHLPSLTQTLTLGYALAASLTLVNVYITAQLMFINTHDLTLAGLLLLFAGGISLAFGYFASHSIVMRLRRLVDGARTLSEGRFATRVPIVGQDEVAQVTAAFNAMAERLETANTEAHALDSARRDLVAWASHDLRTPLTSLRAMLDALADGVVSDPESVARYLRQSQAEISRMSTLIDDLFELAQMDAGRLVLPRESSSLSDLVSDTLQSFTTRAESKGVSITGDVERDVDPVWIAPDKIGRVLQNLLDNALRHTPTGGRIHLHAQTHANSVRISVADTGAGIAPEDLPHVFERFYRGEKSRTRDGYGDGGAGLGLAIVKGLIEAHAGQIHAESRLGAGTTMIIELPRQEPTP